MNDPLYVQKVINDIRSYYELVRDIKDKKSKLYADDVEIILEKVAFVLKDFEERISYLEVQHKFPSNRDETEKK